MVLKITGLAEIRNKLKNISEKTNALKGTSTHITDVLTNEFVSDHSSFSNLDMLIKASGFKVECKEDFDAIPDDEWDSFISKSTKFQSWQEMVNTAGLIYAKKQIGV